MAKPMAQSALACVFALVALTSCGSGESPATAVQSSSAETAQVVGSASPLEAVVGFSSDASERNQQLLTMQRRANERVVACMAQEGFEYVPEPVSPSLLLGPRSGDGTRAWVEVNGLGITTSLIELSRPQTNSGDATAANAAYTATLNAVDAAIYDLALVGESAAVGTFSPDGCWGQAYFLTVRRLAVLDEFDQRLDVLNMRMNGDPRVRVLMERWSTCMAGAGHTHADRPALVDDLFARLLAIEYVQTGTSIEFVDATAVNALLADEIAVAIDDFDCRAAIDAELQSIRADYEREFLADHRARLDQILNQ